MRLLRQLDQDNVIRRQKRRLRRRVYISQVCTYSHSQTYCNCIDDLKRERLSHYSVNCRYAHWYCRKYTMGIGAMC